MSVFTFHISHKVTVKNLYTVTVKNEIIAFVNGNCCNKLWTKRVYSEHVGKTEMPFFSILKIMYISNSTFAVSWNFEREYHQFPMGNPQSAIKHCSVYIAFWYHGTQYLMVFFNFLVVSLQPVLQLHININTYIHTYKYVLSFRTHQ